MMVVNVNTEMMLWTMLVLLATWKIVDLFALMNDLGVKAAGRCNRRATAQQPGTPEASPCAAASAVPTASAASAMLAASAPAVPTASAASAVPAASAPAVPAASEPPALPKWWPDEACLERLQLPPRRQGLWRWGAPAPPLPKASGASFLAEEALGREETLGASSPESSNKMRTPKAPPPANELVPPPKPELFPIPPPALSHIRRPRSAEQQLKILFEHGLGMTQWGQRLHITQSCTGMATATTKYHTIKICKLCQITLQNFTWPELSDSD